MHPRCEILKLVGCPMSGPKSEISGWTAQRGILQGFTLFFIMYGTLQAQTPRITLSPVFSGLSQPVFVTSAKDGSNRLYVVEQAGRIRVFEPGSTSGTLFLDVTSRVLFGGERGLLGLAFHPQFSTNRLFYINYTRTPDGATVVAEYRDGIQQRILFTVAQPYENHNGGMIEFGPDGYLYIGMGDGGSGNDPQNHAQNPNDLLGKILRIHVDVPNSRPEIFAYGFRNPWRFSFDRLTGELYAGDVGQNAREEIDIVTQGGNYGWRVWEGTLCTGLGPAPCSGPGFIPPIIDYVNTGSNGRCAVIGGYVYRGTHASLPYGAYVYGDLCSGEIFMWNDQSATVLLDAPFQISSFGEDEAGEIYVVGLNGSIFRLTNPDAIVAAQRPYGIGDSGLFATSTAGSASVLTVGYGRIQTDAGHPAPSGLEILGYERQGVLVSETSIPASRPLGAGRIVVEVGGSVNTGIALANPNATASVVSFYFTDASGRNFGEGRLTIPANAQLAAFLNEVPFNGGDSVSGTFTFKASAPVAAAALRGFTNERGDFLMTTLPVIDLAAAVPDRSTVAYFAAGGGWSTQIALVNPFDNPVAGTVEFVDAAGKILQTAPYSLAPRASASIRSTSNIEMQTGSIRISGRAAALGILSFTTDGVTVTQAGVPAVPAGTAFRMYAGSGSSIRSGVAIANLSAAAVDVTLEFDGRSAILSIPANGETTMFLNEIPEFASLPVPLESVLRVTSAMPVVVMGLRSHMNRRGELLITTTLFADETAASESLDWFFPHFADGAGYSVRFILFGGSASGAMYFIDQAGNARSLLFR
jgi:hypothetical protein